jgi:hypothetical protein
MRYAVEMGSGTMICMPTFIKIGSGLQTLIWGDTQIHRQYGDHINLLLFLQNKESTLKSTKTENVPRSNKQTVISPYLCDV